jgi:eukaryotic-like serine/threonine-protein kinase
VRWFPFTQQRHSEKMLSRFTLGGLLGSGASASVFLATDTLTGDAVAVKVLHPRIAARPKQAARFVDEAVRMQGIEHLNITGVIAWGQSAQGEEPAAWIAYELAPGISLVEYVEIFGPLAPAEAATLARGVLAGLGALHHAGLVHRDVSPQNVMIDTEAGSHLSSSNIKLIDYGLVGKAGTTTRTKSGVVGNAHYISPEQARGAGVYPSGDIYQAGAVLYFALTGQTPFSGNSSEELVHAHLDQTPPVPSAVMSGIPRELDRAVVKAMLKSPMMRYRNVDEFSRSLAAIFGRDDTATEVLPVPSGQLDHTKVLPAAEAASFVDLDRTLLLATSSAKSEFTQRSISKPRRGFWKNLTAAPWVWPTIFGTLLVAAVVMSVVSAQPGMRDLAPGAIRTSGDPTATSPPTGTHEVTMLSVPSMADLTPEEALHALEAVGLLLGKETRIDSALAVDHVISSDPVAGALVPPGTSVSLTVATGRNKVPQVAGLTSSEALQQLSDAGFTVALLGDDGVPIVDASSAATVRVLQLKPSGGSLLRVGSTVIAVVSSSSIVGPSPTSSAVTTTTPGPTVTPLP